MALVEERHTPPLQESRRQQARVGRKGIAWAPTVAVASIVAYALGAWVVDVEGDMSVSRRGMFLVLVALTVPAIIFVVTRLSLHARGWAMLLIGVVGLSIIGPVAGSHLAKHGLEGNVLTGAIAVAGSLVLIVSGAVLLVRLASTLPRKLLAVPVGFMLLQFVIYPLGGAVYTTQAAHPRLGSRTPASVGLRYESVTITSHDGTHLAAWYVPSRNGGAVILRHGSGSTRTATLDHAAFLAEAGFGVLLTDARGHGESHGEINEIGWHGIQDIEATLDYLDSRPDVSGRIGILGLSMGAEEALNAAAGDERVAAVVAEGAGVSNYRDSIANGAHPVARTVNWTQYAFTDLLSDASQPAGIAASIHEIAPRPVLLIVGDDAIEKTMGPIYRDAGGRTTELWMLPDTPHTDGLEVHPAAYKGRVLEIFEASLLTLGSS